MVISFSHDTAFTRLRDRGEVVTFRERRRKRPNCETWCNRGRGQGKEFDVEIEEIGERAPDHESLAPHAGVSGFGGVDEWIEAIRDLNGGVPDAGYLYRVRRADGEWSDERPQGDRWREGQESGEKDGPD